MSRNGQVYETRICKLSQCLSNDKHPPCSVSSAKFLEEIEAVGVCRWLVTVLAFLIWQMHPSSITELCVDGRKSFNVHLCWSSFVHCRNICMPVSSVSSIRVKMLLSCAANLGYSQIDIIANGLWWFMCDGGIRNAFLCYTYMQSNFPSISPCSTTRDPLMVLAIDHSSQVFLRVFFFLPKCH